MSLYIVSMLEPLPILLILKILSIVLSLFIHSFDIQIFYLPSIFSRDISFKKANYIHKLRFASYCLLIWLWLKNMLLSTPFAYPVWQGSVFHYTHTLAQSHSVGLSWLWWESYEPITSVGLPAKRSSRLTWTLLTLLQQEKFFEGRPSTDVLRSKMRKLLGVEESDQGNETEYTVRDPPWVACCLKSYYIDKARAWESRQYQIFETRLVGE